MTNRARIKLIFVCTIICAAVIIGSAIYATVNGSKNHDQICREYCEYGRDPAYNSHYDYDDIKDCDCIEILRDR